MPVRTRFAPSPTGLLHIGSARSALFNYLFARHHGGQYLVRIEDTDRERSKEEYTHAILEGLAWLGIPPDEPPVFQSTRQARHAEVAREMLARGHAYYCYSTADELKTMREQAIAEGRPPRYDGRWRDRDPAEAPKDVPPVIRLKAPRDGETVVHDLIQGDVRVANAELDDMIILRSDGSPTYLHAVVVDDHDMAITHVIRGDDHLTNTFRQVQVYDAMGWDKPRFGHIPLIHGPDGAKLSKRHGALSMTEYREMGFLPEAVRNYLLRLGWSHGDEEIMSTEQAIALFDLGAVGRSPARFDLAKLTSLNAHYLRERPDEELVDLLAPHLAALGLAPDAEQLRRLAQGMPGLKQRSRTLVELAQSAAFYVRPRPIPLDEKGTRLLDDHARAALASLDAPLAAVTDWSEAPLEGACRAQAETRGIGLGKLAQPLRVALTGTTVSPGVFEVMRVLGRSEVMGRIADAAAGRNPVGQQLS